MEEFSTLSSGFQLWSLPSFGSESPAGADGRRRRRRRRNREDTASHSRTTADNTPATESQTKVKMLHQDRPMNPVFGDQSLSGPPSTLRIGQKRCDKDGNFNFLGHDDDPMTGDENRNPVRPRALGRDPSFSPSLYGPGPLSPLSRLPCWSPLEPLPEIESGDDMGGRVPPDGAEEEMRRATDDEKEQMLGESEKVEELLEDEDEEDGVIDWADSDGEFEFSYRSESSTPVSVESGDAGAEGANESLWDQICQERPENGNTTAENRKKAERRRESVEGADAAGSTDSDTDTELPELMEAVWTLQDRERFKAQEMEKHQVQLTMYRRLALIRWVRTLQNRVQEQQNRLQSSFDIILTHRKELLRMGAAAAAQ